MEALYTLNSPPVISFNQSVLLRLRIKASTSYGIEGFRV